MATIVSRGQTIEVVLASELESDNEADYAMSNCCCTFNGSCPEVVAVTVENNTYELELAGALTIELTESVTSGPNTIGKRFEIYFEDADGDPVEDLFEFTVRLVDTPDYAARPTSYLPTLPLWAESVVHTDSGTGICEVYVENTGAVKTWYLVATAAGVVALSAGFTIGVP